MLTRISSRAILYLVDHHIIHSRDSPIYQYGLEILITSTVNLVTILLIGVALGNPISGILYLAMMIPHRTRLGSYHASTYFRCWMLSSLDFIIILFISKLLTQAGLDERIWVIIIIFSCIGLLYKPVRKNAGHPLPIERIRHCKNCSRVIISAEAVILVSLYLFVRPIFLINLSVITLAYEALPMYTKRSA